MAEGSVDIMGRGHVRVLPPTQHPTYTHQIYTVSGPPHGTTHHVAAYMVQVWPLPYGLQCV